MAESEDLGKIINERRLALGYSLGQLANRVGATASQVRDWEKSGGVPDAGTIPKLGAVLGVDPGRLAAAKPREKMTPPPPPSAAPATPSATSASSVRPPASESDGSGAAAGAAAAAAAAARPPGDEPTAKIATGAAAAPASQKAAPVFSDASATGDAADGPRIEDMPTEAVAVVPSAGGPSAGSPSGPPSAPAMAPVPASVATASRPPATSWPDATPDSTPRDGLFGPLNQFIATVLDPNRRYLFWLRVALTFVVLVVFAVILFNVVPDFFDTLKEILETIESTTDDSTTSTTLPSG